MALWCGALAGLCSIALSPSVIEALVQTARIDAILPMAAPPLGTTFRILFALAATGGGIVVGGLLARSIVAPRSAPASRRRRAAEETEAETETEIAQDVVPPVPGRRRALANMERETAGARDTEATETTEAPSAIAEAEPQILTQEPESPPAAASEDETADRPETDIHVAAIGAPSLETPIGIEIESRIEDAQFEPIEDTPAPARSEVPPGIFDVRQFASETWPEETIAQAEVARHDAAPEVEPAAQLFRLPLEDPSSPREIPASAGQRLFDAYAQALAERTSAPGFAFPAPDQAAAPDRDAFAINEIGDETGHEIGHGEVADAGSATTVPFPAGSANRTAAQPGHSAAERISTCELEELSQLELLERLALAMTRRREEVERGAMQGAQAMAEAPFAAIEPTAPATEATLADETQADEAEPFEAPAELESPAATESSPPITPQEPVSALPSNVPSNVPSAMRPVDLSADEDEDDALPGYIPPRHIRVAPSSLEPTFAAPFAPPEAAEAEAAEADSHFDEIAADSLADEEEEERVLEEGYSSLLNLSRTARETAARESVNFVRIDEPESEDGVEPIVIFPGEEAGRAAPFSREAATLDPAETAQPAQPAHTLGLARVPAGERLFDAPHKQDAEEAEKALRAALATLQRMSGAA